MRGGVGYAWSSMSLSLPGGADEDEPSILNADGML